MVRFIVYNKTISHRYPGQQRLTVLSVKIRTDEIKVNGVIIKASKNAWKLCSCRGVFDKLSTEKLFAICNHHFGALVVQPTVLPSYTSDIVDIGIERGGIKQPQNRSAMQRWTNNVVYDEKTVTVKTAIQQDGIWTLVAAGDEKERIASVLGSYVHGV